MAADSTTLRTGRLAPFPPPRFNGDPASDFLTLQEYLKQFQSSLMDSGLGDPTYQYRLVEIDPAHPPDPAFTTIARAQATANLALKMLSDHIAAQDATIAALTARVTALEGP